MQPEAQDRVSERPRCPSRILLLVVLGFAALTAPSGPKAEVRFGRNVRVGGHDFSSQSFDRKNRAVIHLYERSPRNPGCVWRPDGRGGRVKTCHLRRIR